MDGDGRSRWWLEVIDPQTGRKVDVTVGLHSQAASDDRHDVTDARDRVLDALRAAGYALSDIEVVLV